MSWKHSVWRSMARLYSVLPAPVPSGLRVLTYHSVDSVLADDAYGLSVKAAVFRSQMEVVASGKFGKAVSLGTARLDGTPEIAVSFDDGFLDTLTKAAPILADLKVPFTAAVTQSFVESGKAPHMSVSRLRELASVPGAEIGAHGSAHLRLADVPDDVLAKDLSDSRRFVEDALGRACAVMTWPHGSASRRAAAAAKAAGFSRAGCSLYGVNEPGREPLLLKRTEIVAFDSPADFEAKCAGGWDFFALRQGDPAA